MIGRSLSHFRIVEKIGEGGMGVVYRAEDTRLQRPVALKVLPPELVGDEERRKRFLREARAAAAVTHPNIATIYHVDEAGGMVFIAMELIEGRTLREMIGGRPMPLTDALRIATGVAEGLARAHKAGVVHRDLKPDNVIISADGSPKILDFGLAKMLERGSGDPGGVSSQAGTFTDEMTREGKIFGTPAYMSPEQARGKPVDERSDIFSFGTTLYEMVTGRPPFMGETKTDVLSAILRERPEFPSVKNPKIPQELDLFIASCLEKDPGDRYQHSLQLAVELRKLERMVALPAPVNLTLSSAFKAVQAESKKRQNRALVASVTMFIAALYLLVGWLVWIDVGGVRARLFGSGNPGRIESLAVLPLENLSGDPAQDYFADGMTEALITDLSKIGALKVISRTSAMRYKGSDKSLPQIARELGVHAVIEGSVLHVGDQVRITAQLIEAATDELKWSESYERELSDVLRLQGEIARSIAEEIKIKLTDQQHTDLQSVGAVNPVAYESYLRGRYYANKGKEEGLRRSIHYYKQAIKEDAEFALAFAGLADSYFLLSTWYLPPKEAMPQAKMAALKALEHNEMLAESHTALGNVHLYYDWDWLAAEREFRRALELDPNEVGAHLGYAAYFLAMDRTEEGIAEIHRALELDPLSLNWRGGWLLFLAREYERAVQHMRELLEFEPDYAFAHALLGLIYEQEGRSSEALEAFQRARNLEDSPFFVIYGAYGHAMLGQRGEAKRILREVRRISQERYVCGYEVGMVYANLGEIEQAFEWFEQALEDRADCWVFAPPDPRLGSIRSNPRFQAMLRRVGFPAD